jgi:glycosyltransferase involved in cell wall biosynthesis
MSRPHVLYTTPIFGYPAFGGPRLRTYNTLKALARVADVSLYLTDQPDALDWDAARQHLLAFCRDVHFPEAPPRPGLVRRVGRRFVPPGLRARLRGGHTPASDEATAPRRDPAVVEGLRQWIATKQPDVLWLGFGGISYDLVPLKDESAAKLVLETECVWSRFILRELPFETDPARRERILRDGQAKEAEERIGASHVDVTTAASEVDAEYFRSIAPDPDRVQLIANVIDVSAYSESHGSVALQQPALLFAGTFSVGTANLDATEWLLDEVMPTVWSVRPDVHVYLVGRSPAPSILDRRGPRVHVTGEVPSIVPYMRASAAAIVPLRWESGTRFKILEAFACGTPVISTTLGAEGLAVEDERHLLLADDPASFAKAILAIVEEPAAGQLLVGPALDLVQREYDVSSAARQIEAVLSRLGLEATV